MQENLKNTREGLFWIINFSALDKLAKLRIYFKHKTFPLPCTDRAIQRSLYYVRVAVIIFSWSKWFGTHRKKLEELHFVDEEV